MTAIDGMAERGMWSFFIVILFPKPYSGSMLLTKPGRFGHADASLEVGRCRNELSLARSGPRSLTITHFELIAVRHDGGQAEESTA
jgi:hypothetical protein